MAGKYLVTRKRQYTLKCDDEDINMKYFNPKYHVWNDEIDKSQEG